MRMRRVVQMVIVFAVAVITEFLLFSLFVAMPGGNAGGIWIPNASQMVYVYVHIPAKTIVENLGCDDFPHFFVCCFVTGPIQFFLVYWVALVIWGRIQQRRSPSQKNEPPPKTNDPRSGI